MSGDGIGDLVLGEGFVSTLPVPPGCEAYAETGGVNGAVRVFEGPLPTGDVVSEAADLSLFGSSPFELYGLVVHAADFDNDGYGDIVAAGFELFGPFGEQATLELRAGPAFDLMATFDTPVGSVLHDADLDGNGTRDLLAGGTVAWLGPYEGAYTAFDGCVVAADRTWSRAGEDRVVEDLDADGLADLLFVWSGGEDLPGVAAILLSQ